ncbi:hypothetical protein FTX61_02430 [Nitriliruptoraceae bacterium ZYF776]|nr:hypothetical protein [Profundirhabdus halotolerans]
MPLSPDAPDPDATPRDGAHRRRKRPLLRASLGLLVLAGGGLAAQQVASADAAATERERAAASTSLHHDVSALRTALADPARDGHVAATALARHQLAVLAGDADDDLTEQLVEDLREAAAQLAEASGTPLPDRPEVLSVAAIDPVFARLDGLEQQAAQLAERFTVAADEAASFDASLRELDAAAAAYAEGAADASGSTPEEVAASWDDELERLEAYDEALAEARELEALRPTVEAHERLVDGMRELAEAAQDDLADGDLDAHNERLEETLAGDDPFGVVAALRDARTDLAERWAEGPLQQARSEALGLLTELDHLRRATPPAAWRG